MPSVQAWFDVGAVSVGVPRTVAENVSVADKPLVSVAVTTMLSVCAVVGAVPLNVSVAALKLSQHGSACPFAKAAR